MTPPNVTEQTLKQLVKVLKSPGCRKTPVFVKDVGMACELAGSFVEEKYVVLFRWIFLHPYSWKLTIVWFTGHVQSSSFQTLPEMV